MSRIINLSAKFMRENPTFMGKLTQQQQKIWFATFLGLLDNEEPEQGEAFQVSLENIRIFIGSTNKNTRNLKQKIIAAFNLFEELYVNYAPEGYVRPIPFYLNKVEKGIAYFRVGDPYLFAYQNRRGRQHFKIDLDEISSYKNLKHCSRTIPLLWYCLSHRHLSKDKSHWEISFGDYQLKEALGLDPLDYTYIPEGQREFYTLADYFLHIRPKTTILNYLEEKYNIQSTKELKDRYCQVKNTTFFKRWDFEQKVLLPAIEELNNGHMINFILQDVWKRAPAGEAATKVKSYIGKNYSESPGVLVDDFHIIDKNVLNFRKLQSGNQYTFLIKKQNLNNQ